MAPALRLVDHGHHGPSEASLLMDSVGILLENHWHHQWFVYIRHFHPQTCSCHTIRKPTWCQFLAVDYTDYRKLAAQMALAIKQKVESLDIPYTSIREWHKFTSFSNICKHTWAFYTGILKIQYTSQQASQPASKQAAATSICPLERMIKYYKYSKLPQYRNETFSRHTAP